MFCYAGCGGEVTAGTPRAVSGRDGREMSLADVKRILRVFKEDARIPFFSFTGGEPLLRADLEEMIRHARSLGLQVNLMTNGTLADVPRARSLFRAGLRTAQVSLESPREQAHDHLTRRPGSWQRTLQGIRNLRDAGISVQTNTTVTAFTSLDAPLMPAFLKGLGVTRFAMNLYIPVGQRDGRSPTSGSPTSGSPAGAVGAGVRTSATHDDELLVPYARAGRSSTLFARPPEPKGLSFSGTRPSPTAITTPLRTGWATSPARPWTACSPCLPPVTCCPAPRTPSPWATCWKRIFGGSGSPTGLRCSSRSGTRRRSAPVVKALSPARLPVPCTGDRSELRRSGTPAARQWAPSGNGGCERWRCVTSFPVSFSPPGCSFLPALPSWDSPSRSFCLASALLPVSRSWSPDCFSCPRAASVTSQWTSARRIGSLRPSGNSTGSGATSSSPARSDSP